MIVIDEGSTDATERVLRPFCDRLSYHRTPNGGPVAARNEGMRRATGDYVAWLDSDDVWAPEKLALQVAVMERRPEVVLVSSDFWAFAGDTVLERSHIASDCGVLRREAGGIASRYGERTVLRVRVAGEAETVPLYVGSVRDALVSGNWVHPRRC